METATEDQESLMELSIIPFLKSIKTALVEDFREKSLPENMKFSDVELIEQHSSRFTFNTNCYIYIVLISRMQKC